MKRYSKFIIGILVLTVIFGTIYTVSQQVLRQAANDPQVQIAEDTAAALNSGTAPGDSVSGKVDMASSLAPFVIIYDKNGKVVTGSGYLDGTVPTVPFGVLSHANFDSMDSHTDNRVTWQPSGDVRVASVVVPAKDYYVLSGRNLREVENRENQMLELSALGWGLSLAVVLALYPVHRRLNSTK